MVRTVIGKTRDLWFRLGVMAFVSMLAAPAWATKPVLPPQRFKGI